jgi:hypothetical protein
MNDMSQPPSDQSSTPSSPGYGAPVPPAAGYQNSASPYSGPYSPVQEPSYNVLAIVSFISAFFVSLVAVITGHMALGQIKRTGEKGRGLALAGLIIGYVGIASGIIAVIVFVVMAIAGVGLFATIASQYDPDDYSYTSDPYATDEPGAGWEDVTFSDGTSLTSSDLAQFTDPFIADSSWTVKSPDDGNGNWSYTDPSGLCSVQFHQGAIESALVVANDDRATTDAMLAALLSSTPADLSSYLTDDTFAAGYSGDGSIVDTRSISSTDPDGSSTLFAGRAFAGIPAGLYVVIDCASGGDIDSVYDEVKTSASIVVN